MWPAVLPNTNYKAINVPAIFGVGDRLNWCFIKEWEIGASPPNWNSQ